MATHSSTLAWRILDRKTWQAPVRRVAKSYMTQHACMQGHRDIENWMALQEFSVWDKRLNLVLHSGQSLDAVTFQWALTSAHLLVSKYVKKGFSGGTRGQKKATTTTTTAYAGDLRSMVSIPVFERSPEEGHGNNCLQQREIHKED